MATGSVNPLNTQEVKYVEYKVWSYHPYTLRNTLIMTDGG